MFLARCILVLAALTTVSAATARTIRPGEKAPDRFGQDSLERTAEARNQRLYDSLRSKTGRHAVPRLLYGMLFRHPTRDTTASGRVTDENTLLRPYAGKTIGDIRIERKQVFNPDGNWLRRTGNKIHALTRERVIRRDLLFDAGDPLDPELIVRNKQLLRERPYISDVEIAVQPDSLDTTRVDLVIRTRDSWTITVDGGWHSEGRTMVGLHDANIFGTGNTLKVNTNFSRKDFSYGGNTVEYEIPNVLGTFYTAEAGGGRDFYNTTLDLQLRKEFLRPTDYEAGAAYSNRKYKEWLIEQDTSYLVRVRNLDFWGGYSRLLAPIASSIYLTGHYNHRRFLLRPDDVSSGNHPALHGRDVLLFGLGLYRERFMTANMIYGFGHDEYLPTGYKAEVESGYSWGEFADAIYLGLNYRTGGFRPIGYIMGGFTLGSYIDRITGKWSHSAVDVDLRWFSNLFIFRRSRLRQFLMFNYTQGWNRTAGNNESIGFTRANGLHALREPIRGTNRMVLDTESVLFTPWQPLGFRIALFGFADFGLIGYSPNIFRNDFFTSLGAGIRIKNERLIFSTVEVRFGVALGKNGLVGSDYFRLSNSIRLEEYRYRPGRPEIVGFE